MEHVSQRPSKEVVLAINLIMRGKSLPAKLKESALQDVSLAIMELEEGQANYHLLSMLYDAIETEDADGLHELSDMVGTMLPSGHDGGRFDSEDLERLYELAKATSIKFAEEKDKKPRLALLNKLAESEGMVPIYYHPGFLLLFCPRHDELIVAGVNVDCTRSSLAKELGDMDDEDKAKTIGLLHRISGKPCYEPIFARIVYDVYADDQMTVNIEEV